MNTVTRNGLRALLALPEADRKIGPFLLVRQLGRGGFAPVWLAREVYGSVELRVAALKLFDAAEEPASSLGRGPSSQSRRALIVDEARALCRVEHPDVVRLHALHTDDALGVVALAMEHVAGDSLAALLTRRSRSPPYSVWSWRGSRALAA